MRKEMSHDVFLEDAPRRNQIIDDDIPQAFSHWSYQYTQTSCLVCDLQGVIGKKSFSFTDPAIHSSKNGTYGLTDHGKNGQRHFFETHECNPLCKQLGLRQGFLG